jgi:flagellin-specific chaperone FliS
MSKLDDAKREYTKAYDRIVKLAEPITAWRAELEACEVEAPRLADDRIAALTRDDVPTADKLHDQIRQKQSRAADLRSMIAKRTAEIGAAVSAIYDHESRAVMRAQIEAAAIEKQSAQDEIARLAPAWNKAQHRYQAVQQLAAGMVYFETEFLDQRNRDQFLHGVLFQLLGSGEGSDYKPSWLMN